MEEKESQAFFDIESQNKTLNPLLVVVDGNSLMYRAFYGLPPLTNAEGLHTNVILGFVNMVNKIKEKYAPGYMAIAFDRAAPTFRHKEYEAYKAGRQKMPDEMAEQIPIVKQVLDILHIARLELDGYEADDIIGTLARHAEKKKIQTKIVTGDRDAFQLINEDVHVLFTKKGTTDMEEYDEALLMEKMQVTPSQIVDLKSLMGDSSDNIPGIPGVGEKTALDLIKTFGTLEVIYEKSEEIKKKGVREKVQNNREIAYQSYHLAKICCDVPLKEKIEDLVVGEPDLNSLKEIFMELNFKALLTKMEVSSVPVDGGKAKQEAEMLEGYDVRIFADKICNAKRFYLKTDGTYIYSIKNDLPIRMKLTDAETVDMLKGVLEDRTVEKYGHNLKADHLCLRQFGIQMEGETFDTAIANYLIDPSKSNYDEMPYGQSQEALVMELPALCVTLENELKEKELWELFQSVEMPLVNILADMEYTGFYVNQDVLKELSIVFGEKIEGLTKSIFALAGEEFNINSPKQLGVVLFEKLSLPATKKTKTGYSTNVEVLEKLRDQHPIVNQVLEYRQLVKLKSTYVDGLLGMINIKTGRIHSKLNQMVTSTGRLSSTDPNLQNIPVKTEEGKQIRKAFVAKKGCVLLDADYSQIELRVLAHISGDENMIQAFRDQEDIHTKTAAEVFGVDKSQVTSALRGRAKAINFGIVYGLSDFGLAKDIGISRKEAKEYIENYFRRYPKVKEYTVRIVEEAKKNGYVKTIMNRRRYIGEIQSKNAIMRGMGERIAMNTPIQGSAADIIKIAMVKVHRELERRGLKSKLILQVHDELIIETYEEELEAVRGLVQACMEHAIELHVPVIVDIGSAKSWYEAK